MKTKRIICLSIVLCLGLAGFAQMQQGIAKTNGRMENGKYVKGKTVANVTVQVKGGSAVLSKANGDFSFPTPNKQFSLQQVQKQGYILLDPDMLTRQYTYSANPFVILMADKAEQDAYRRSIEHSFRNKLYSDLEARTQELDELKKQNKITEEKYRELLQQINSDYDNNEKIVKEMADLYSKMDFDSVDDFNRRVSDCIINGRLDEALSLIRSKGDLNERAKELDRLSAANAASRETLNRSESMEAKMRDGLAQDYYDLFNIFKMKHQNDSAAYYIVKRANLDSTNTEWSINAGKFLQYFTVQFELAKTIYERALRVTLESKDEDIGEIITCYEALGNIYSSQGKYDSAKYYYLENVRLSRKIEATDESWLVFSYCSLAGVYRKTDEFDKAYALIDTIEPILAHCKISDISKSKLYGNIGNLFSSTHKYKEALKYYLKSDSCLDDDVNSHIIETVTTWGNIGFIYTELGMDSIAMIWLNKTCSLILSTLGENHPKLASTYSSIGKIYINKKEWDIAENYAIKSIKIEEKKLGGRNPELIVSYNNLAHIYSAITKHNEAIEYFNKALTLCRLYYSEKHSVSATLYNNIGSEYYRQGNDSLSLVFLNKSLEIRKSIFGESDGSVALSYFNIGRVYETMGNNSPALIAYEKAYIIFSDLFGEEDNRTKISLSAVKKMKENREESIINE